MGLFYSPESENGFRDRQEELRKGRSERFNLFQQASKDASERGIEMSPQDFADLTSQLSGAGNELLYRNAFPQGSMLQRYQEHQNRQAQIGKLNQAASLADADKKAQEGFSSLLNGMNLEQDDAQIISELNKNYPGFMDTGYGKYVPRLGEMKAKIFSNRANEVIAANPGWKNIQTYESLELANDQIDKAAGGSKVVAQKIRDELTSKVNERVRLDINKAFASMKPEEYAQIMSYANPDEQLAIVKGVLQRSGVTPRELQEDLKDPTKSHIQAMIASMKTSNPVYLATSASAVQQASLVDAEKSYKDSYQDKNSARLLGELEAIARKPLKEGDPLYNAAQSIASSFYIDDKRLTEVAKFIHQEMERSGASPQSAFNAVMRQYGNDGTITGHAIKKKEIAATITRAKTGGFMPGDDLQVELEKRLSGLQTRVAAELADIKKLEAVTSTVPEVQRANEARATAARAALRSKVEQYVTEVEAEARQRPGQFRSDPKNPVNIDSSISSFRASALKLLDGAQPQQGNQGGQQKQNNQAPQPQTQPQTQAYSLDAAGYATTSRPEVTEMVNKKIAGDPALKARHDALVASAATARQLAQTQQQPQQSGSGRFPSGPSYKHQYEQSLMQLRAFRAAIAASAPGYLPGRSTIPGNP